MHVAWRECVRAAWPEGAGRLSPCGRAVAGDLSLTPPPPPPPSPGLPTPLPPRPSPPAAGDDAASLFSKPSSNRGPPSLGQRVCAALPYLVPFIDVVAMGIEALRTVPQLTWVHDLPSECVVWGVCVRVEINQQQTRSL